MLVQIKSADLWHGVPKKLWYIWLQSVMGVPQGTVSQCDAETSSNTTNVPYLLSTESLITIGYLKPMKTQAKCELEFLASGQGT